MPVVVAAAIGAAGVVGASALANKGAKKAANAQTQAANQANATQLQIYNQQRADSEPWRQVGLQALDRLGQVYGFKASDGTQGDGLGDPTKWLQMDPGYQFRLKEGQNQLQTSLAARGMSQSGAAVKAAQRYGQDYASGEFNTAWNRLAGLAGVGQQVNQTNNQLATNYANQTGANTINAGNARASSYAQQGQNTANAFGYAAGRAAQLPWGNLFGTQNSMGQGSKSGLDNF